MQQQLDEQKEENKKLQAKISQSTDLPPKEKKLTKELTALKAQLAEVQQQLEEY